MLSSTRAFTELLDAKNFSYRDLGPTSSGRDTLSVGIGGKNMSGVTIRFFFDTDCHGASLRVFDILKFTDEQRPKILETINNLNQEYRFAKFCAQDDDNTVQMEMDLIFRENDVAEICEEAMVRAYQICDDAYPTLMKARWS